MCSPVVYKKRARVEARGLLRGQLHTVPKGVLLIYGISSHFRLRLSRGFPSQSNIQRHSHDLQGPTWSTLHPNSWPHPPALSTLLTLLQPHQHRFTHQVWSCTWASVSCSSLCLEHSLWYLDSLLSYSLEVSAQRQSVIKGFLVNTK